jgi:hypothetical protein
MTEPVHAALLDHQVLEEIEMSTNLMIIASDSSGPLTLAQGDASLGLTLLSAARPWTS